MQYSDQPCEAGQKSSELRIQAPQPMPKPRSTDDAAAREKLRQQHEASSERSRRIEDADAKIRQIKSENHNPARCAEARRKMALIQQRDPMHSINLDYIEYSRWAELYCGN